MAPDSPKLPGSRRDTHTEATRRALLRAARRLFAQHGYAGAGIEGIARRARVTSGALYHHFGSKEGLFRAVAEQIEQEVMERATAAALAHTDPWEMLRAGIDAVLDAAAAQDVRRIVFMEGPNVLGPEAWREIEARYSFGQLRSLLDLLMRRGVLAPAPVELLARMVLAMQSEVAQSVARAEDPASARAQAGEVVSRLLQSLRA